MDCVIVTQWRAKHVKGLIMYEICFIFTLHNWHRCYTLTYKVNKIEFNNMTQWDIKKIHISFCLPFQLLFTVQLLETRQIFKRCKVTCFSLLLFWKVEVISMVLIQSSVKCADGCVDLLLILYQLCHTLYVFNYFYSMYQ